MFGLERHHSVRSTATAPPRSCQRALRERFLKQTAEFLSKTLLLDPNQSGVQSGHSLQGSGVFSVTDTRSTSSVFALILLDPSAAFDAVSHCTPCSLGLTGASLPVHLPALNLTSLASHPGRGGARRQPSAGIPVGPGLGPLVFPLWGFSYHRYADDAQRYI